VLDPEKLKDQLLAPSDDEKPDEDLPAITTLNLDVVGEKGKRYTASLTYKVPNLGEQILIGNMQAQYLPRGGLADSNAALLTEQICYLTVTLQRPLPDWWKPFAFFDATPVSALYALAVAYERRFHGADAKPKRPEETAREGEADDSGDGVEAVSAVGRKVQAPAKRSEVLVSHSSRSR
jgi:hypothetical protein